MGTYVETVEIHGDAADLESTLTGASSKIKSSAATWGSALTAKGKALDATGKKMMSFGRSATTHVTLPILAAGAAGFKMAADFDSSINKLVALAGVPRKVAEGWRDDFISLSNSTGQSATDLSGAMFLIASSGLKGKAAMDTLTASAHASAAGMGDVDSVADAATSTMNAFGPETMTASHALDVLAATAKAGKLDTTELAGAIGRVLPFAAKAKVAFEDVGAALASQTKVSGDVNEAVTNTSDLLRFMATPTTGAAKALEDMGLSSQKLAQTLAQKGLPAAVQLLNSQMEKTKTSAAELQMQVSGQTALNTLAAKSSTNYADAQAIVAKNSGMVEDALKKSQGPGLEAKKTWEQLKNALMTTVQSGMPAIVGFLKSLQGLLNMFNQLPEGTKQFILQMLAMSAAAGPLTSVLGGLFRVVGGGMKLFGAAASGISTFARSVSVASAASQTGQAALLGVGSSATASTGPISSMIGAMGGFGPAAAIVGGTVAAFAAVTAAANELGGESRIKVSEFIDTAGAKLAEGLAKGGVSAQQYAQQAAKLDEVSRGAGDGLTTQAVVMENLDAAYAKGAITAAQYSAALQKTGFDARQASNLIENTVNALQQSITKMESMAPATTKTGKALQTFSGFLNQTRGATEEEKTAIAGLVGKYVRAHGSLKGLNMETIKQKIAMGDAAGAQKELQGKVAQATKQFGKQINTILKSKSAQQQWGSALTKANGLTNAQTVAIGKGIHEIEASGKSLTAQQKSVLQSAIKTGTYSKATAVLTQALGKLPKSVKSQIQALGATEGTVQVQQLNQQLESLAGKGTITVHVNFVKTGASVGGLIGGSAGGVIGAQVGGIVRRPTLMVGEGRYPTFAGRGAEAVVPLDSRGIAILARAFQMAISGLQVGGEPPTIIVEAPPYKEFRRAVAAAWVDEASRGMGL